MAATVTMTTLSWAETAPGVSWPDAHAGSDHDRYSGTNDQWTARVAYRDRTRVSSHVELEAGIRESERSGPDDRRARRSKKPALEDSGYASVPEQEPEIAEPNGPLDHGLPVECSKDPHPGFDSIHATSPTLQPFSSFGTAQPMDAPVAQVGNADIDREVEFLFDEALALIEGGQDTKYLQWGPRGFVPQAKVAKVIAESERLNIDAPSSKIRNAPKFVPYFTAPLYPPVAENHNPDSVMDNVELLFAEAEAFLETGEDTKVMRWGSRQFTPLGKAAKVIAESEQLNANAPRTRDKDKDKSSDAAAPEPSRRSKTKQVKQEKRTKLEPKRVLGGYMCPKKGCGKSEPKRVKIERHQEKHKHWYEK